MQKSELILVYTTHSSEKEAEILAEKLLRKSLIACANIFPAGQSLYKWNGGFQIDKEVIAIFKTSSAKLEELETEYKKEHPYDTPCFVALPSSQASESYHAWATSQLTNHPS